MEGVELAPALDRLRRSHNTSRAEYASAFDSASKLAHSIRFAREDRFSPHAYRMPDASSARC